MESSDPEEKNIIKDIRNILDKKRTRLQYN